MRRERHKKIARLQDIAVETLYRVFPRGVLHGGTAIWRCYSGNRFSEDVDIYIQKDADRINRLFEELERAGFEIIKKRTTKNSLYSSLSFEGVEVRLEALFKRASGVVREYETYEGILLNVFTLTPEEMIDEKISAYMKRGKVRDLYDIFFLLRYVEKNEPVKARLRKLLRDFQKPVDEKELKTLIMFGAIPTTKHIVEYLGRRAT
jgi:predicted nucleotidyltransferase component of viral defense system